MSLVIMDIKKHINQNITSMKERILKIFQKIRIFFNVKISNI